MNVGKVDGLVTRLIREVGSNPTVPNNADIVKGIHRSDSVSISKSARVEFEKMLKYVEESS